MSNIEYFIVEGGHDGDPDPEETGRIRVRQMGKHGQNVKTEHLPLNQTLKSDASEFHRPPTPGTILAGYVPKGAEHTGYSHLLGSFATKQESGASVPGNTTLPFLDKAQNIELKIKLPPNIKSILESNRTGLEKFKKEIDEKGEKFKQATLRGLPSDGAVFALSGIRNTPFKNISTAIDKAASQMTSSKLAGLSGLVSSLDLNSLISQLISQLDLPDTMVQTLESFVKTASGDINSVSPPGGASLGNLINQEKFLTKALDLMKDVKTTGELLRVIQTLQHPDTLADTLSDISNVSINSDSIFGAIKQEINSKGEIVEVANDFIENIKNALQSLLSSIPGTGIDGESFFTSEGTPIQDLIQRMKDTAKATELKEAVEKVSSSMNSRKQKQRTNNNSAGKGATQDIIFKAKQLIARDGRVVPFFPTTKNGVSGTTTSVGTPGSDPSPVPSSNVAAEALIAAIAAFDKANSAFDTANSAVGSSSGQAGNTANSALLVAQAAFGKANSANDIAVSAYSTINTESSRLTSAFGQANNALSVGQAAFAKANTYVASDASNTLNTALGAFTKANTASNTAVGAFDKANAEATRLTSAYATVNAESTRLTSAYATVNAESSRLTSAFGQANTANLVAKEASNVATGSFAKANAEATRLTSAYATINSESIRLTSAFATANAKMNPDFSNANTVVPNTNMRAPLRENIKQILDWNEANTNGWYAGANSANAPTQTAATDWYVGMVTAFSNDYTEQVVYSLLNGGTATPSANTYSYRRTQRNAVWGDWVRILRTQEEIRTEAYSNAAGERTRLTSAYAAANGTYSDSGYFTSIVTPQSGSIVSYSANGHFKRIDLETGFFSINVAITNKGTAGGAAFCNVPFVAANTFFNEFAGRRSDGSMLQGQINPASNSLIILVYDNSSPFATGNLMYRMSGVVRTQPFTG